MKINIMPLCLSLLFFSLLIQYAEKIKISETAPDSIETAFDYIQPVFVFSSSYIISSVFSNSRDWYKEHKKKNKVCLSLGIV